MSNADFRLYVEVFRQMSDNRYHAGSEGWIEVTAMKSGTVPHLNLTIPLSLLEIVVVTTVA